jgi:anti-sigma B factor antagonist
MVCCRFDRAAGDVASELEIATERLGTAVLVTVSGEIDNATAHQLRAAVAAAFQRAGLPEEAGVVAVDLTRVDFLGAAGLSVLIEAASEAEWTTKPLRIVVDEHHPVIRPIQINGLDAMLTLCDSLADAVQLEL